MRAGTETRRLALEYMIHAWPNVRRLAAHWMVCAFLRAPLSTGSRMLIRIPMMPMTTSSSTSVNARFREGDGLKLLDTSLLSTPGKPFGIRRGAGHLVAAVFA